MGNSDSHATFVDGVKQLLVRDVPEDDEDFWAALFGAPMTVEDVFEIVGPDNVRQLRQKRPHNLQALLRNIISTMSDVCKVGEERGQLPASTATTAFTTLRLLTRLAPFLQEDPRDPTLEAILWRTGGLPQENGTAAPRKSTDGDVVGASEEPPSVSTGTVADSSPTQEREPCGHAILYCVNRFLFLPGFTVVPRVVQGAPTPNSVPTHRVDARVVWKFGVGVADQLPPMPTNAQFVRARAEVLRCLLACLSGPLFQTADEYRENPPRWLLRFTGGEVCHTANLFCSLMSVVFLYDPVGWGVPYGGYFASGTEEDLVDVALQVLCVIMDFAPENVPEQPLYGVVKEKTEEEEEETSSPAKSEKERRQVNVYRYMLQRVSKDTEIDLVFGGLVRLLSTVHKANQTYLPNSFRSVGFYQEALVLLWHLLTLNKAFTSRVVDHLDTNQILLPVLYLLQQSQHAPQLVGLLHTASFVLLVLSCQRSFAVRLNEPYVGKVPLQIPQFHGCHADVVALALQKVISDGIAQPQNDALVEMLLTVLCNVSPYVKSFALESCLKLVSLIERCSRPSYVFRSPFTHHGLLFLLEMVNNVVQYQFEGNAMLVYSILRHGDCFQRLASLELPRARASAANADGGAAEGAGDVGHEEGEEETPGPANGKPWVPTEAWLANLKKKMPLQASLCLIDHLGPRIQAHCQRNDITDQDEVLRFLRQTTLVGILPVPHPIVIRTYQASTYTAMWFTSYMWGVIFTRSQRMPLYDWRQIRLVVVNQ